MSSYLSPRSCSQWLFIDALQMRIDDGVTFGIERDHEHWLLDRQMALAAVERGHDAKALAEHLRQRADQPLAEPVAVFIRAAQKRGTALRALGPALLIECFDADIAARVAAHPETASLCALAGERRLVVRAKHESRFRTALRVVGFGLLG